MNKFREEKKTQDKAGSLAHVTTYYSLCKM